MHKYLDEELKCMTVLNQRLSLASALNEDKEEELNVLADAIVDDLKNS